jgi:hypothetical protein
LNQSRAANFGVPEDNKLGVRHLDADMRKTVNAARKILFICFSFCRSQFQIAGGDANLHDPRQLLRSSI